MSSKTIMNQPAGGRVGTSSSIVPLARYHHDQPVVCLLSFTFLLLPLMIVIFSHLHHPNSTSP